MATFTRLPSGKWRAQVRKAGVYKNATFASKTEARRWATAVEAQLAHALVGGFAPPAKEATLADLIDKYCVDQGRNKSFGKTKLATLRMLRREMGHIQLHMLSPIVLREFIDKREGRAGGVTIAGDLSCLSAVLHWARDVRRLDVNPQLALDARASLKGRGLSTRGKTRQRLPTESELQRIREFYRNRNRGTIEMVVLIEFAIATGMRQGEICRIRVEDVDRENRTVIIRDRKDPNQKHGNDQCVPLLPEAWDLAAPSIEGKWQGRIFPYDERSVSASFTRAMKRLQIKDLRFHDLRHHAATRFFSMGLQIQEVALLTGHKDWKMLRRYTHVQAKHVHEAFARLNLPV